VNKAGLKPDPSRQKTSKSWTPVGESARRVSEREDANREPHRRRIDEAPIGLLYLSDCVSRAGVLSK
jgi:hypothetical protein